MKKTLFILLILILVSAAYAQKINFIGGMSLSRYHVEGLVYAPPPFGPVWRYNSGFIGGMGIEFKVFWFLRFEADALYFQKGSNYSLMPGDKSICNLNTISFPILVKFAFLPDSLPYILAGGEFSIILSEKWDGRDSTVSREKNDRGIILGVGNNIKIPGASFFLEARYHIGLSDINKADDIWGWDQITMQTRTLAIIIGVKI